MSTVFYTSDQHYGHRLVAELRGFDTPDDHDDAIDAAYRAVVTKRDTVYFLGDLAMKGTVAGITPVLERLAALPGAKHLIVGNHDPVHPLHRDAHKFQRLYLDTFDSVQVFARRRAAGTDYLLSHFPYVTDRGPEARFLQYRLPDIGMRLIHGHTHSDKRVTSDREVHVGLDAWSLRPAPERDVLALFDSARATLAASDQSRPPLWERYREVSARLGEGWLPFGWHACLSPVPEVEFSAETDEGGLPLWERPRSWRGEQPDTAVPG